MNDVFDNFINNEKNILAFKRIKEYKPEDILVILDSEFTRKNISRQFSTKLHLWSATIEKKGYSFYCQIDSTAENYLARDIIKNLKKPLIITGIGLYGEVFIKELRMYEKISKIENTNRVPIIIYGSPKNEKLEKLNAFYDLYINNTTPASLRQLEWLINNVFIS